MSLELRKFIVQAVYLERDPVTGRPLREVLAYGSPEQGSAPKEFLDVEALIAFAEQWPEEIVRLSDLNDKVLREAREVPDGERTE